MALVLELVGERIEPLLDAGVRERLFQQPVGEPRVARQQRPVEVRAVRALVAAALEAGGAVVPEARDDAAERLGAVVEDRAAGVVLEPGERLAGPGALEQHVADHPPLARDRVQRQQPDPGQLDARDVAIEAPEQLVAAADGQERGAALDGLAERLALRGEVVRDELLLAVLAAADVEEVDLAAGTASPIPIACTSSSCPRAARAPASTAMLPRSA